MNEPQMNLTQSEPAIQSVSAANGISWITDAWEIFKQAPTPFILAWLLMLLLMLASSVIPFAAFLLSPALIAGYIMGIHKIRQHQNFAMGDLFEGLKTQGSQLIMLGVITIVAALILLLIGAVCFSLGLSGIDSRSSIPLLAGMAIALTLGVTLFLVIASALWFAPSLIVFHQTPPKPAIRLALKALGKNLLPFTVFSLLLLLLSAAISVFVGLLSSLLGPLGAIIGPLLSLAATLVLGPMSMITMYTSYQDIFTLED